MMQKKEYEIIAKYSKLGFNMSLPVDHGICNNGKSVYMHGDFHSGNLIYTNDGSIGVIDFNRWKIGDPYEEFYKLESIGIENSIPYCIGQIDAYFDDKIPENFWLVNAVYVAHASLHSIKWSEKFGQEDIDRMTARCHMAFDDYDDFQIYIPKWYTYKYKNISQ